jgi:hypothetical protein
MPLPIICRTNRDKKAASVVTTTIRIYEECPEDYERSAILLEITSEDMASGGVTLSYNNTVTPIPTAATTLPEQNLFAGLELSWNVNLQAAAFTKIVDELVGGVKAEPSQDNPGFMVLPMGDRVGVALPRYCVVVDYFDGEIKTAFDVAPSCEIKLEGAATMVAGTPLSRQLMIMGYPVDDPEFGKIRARRYWKGNA